MAATAPAGGATPAEAMAATAAEAEAEAEAGAPEGPPSQEEERPQQKKEAPEEPPQLLRVGDVVGQRGAGVVCSRRETLTDAADLLISRDRTATVVLDEHGAAVGAFTENDVLQAYLINVPWHYSVDSWLLSDCARLPNFLVSALTVRPSTPLLEAAAVMRAQATGDFACRHLVVQEASGEPPLGILSSLDLARAICGLGTESDVGRLLGGKRVAEVMKPRANLPMVGRTATLAQAVEEMVVARQNCVLVAEAEIESSGGVLGVITPRDVLRAFVEHIPGDARVDNWLHGLHSRWQPRAVRGDAMVPEAAEVMARSSVHHLVVVSPGTSSEVVGVISCTDLAYAMGAQEHAASVAGHGSQQRDR